MRLRLEEDLVRMQRPYGRHLKGSADLVTTYEATRAGFVALALEKNRLATPYVAEARALMMAASQASSPAILAQIEGIQPALLTAAGVSDKAATHLLPEDKRTAIEGLIERFLEPAGEKFVEELVFRFLLTRGDTIGGSMRNLGGLLAERKLTRAIIASLSIAGTRYRWLYVESSTWNRPTRRGSVDIEDHVRALNWTSANRMRTMVYNIKVPQVGTNVDFCLLDCPPDLQKMACEEVSTYLAFGELKGGIDPAGADEHWKTATKALSRIRNAFSGVKPKPALFFIGVAIVKRMAQEIWTELEGGTLSNAANLNDDAQVASLCQWLCSL